MKKYLVSVAMIIAGIIIYDKFLKDLLAGKK